ncbi:hypothetical protein [Kangiella shandongensis]|uniref:hypothetical protein n=1 Tax=Kangiella shandongensis TaxID=2763258 RepID=UPI001CBDFD2A|nr:hypothetical protein [Kangiella shandongensis]
MFESIAMICYLSMAEPQQNQHLSIETTDVILEEYTGTFGGEPEEEPDEDEKKRE